MRVTAVLALGVSQFGIATAAVASGAAHATVSATVSDRVIVIMRSQPPAVRPGTLASAARSAVIANSQAPLLQQLRFTHATHILTYRLINAFAVTVSAAEAANLRANPAVAEVVPDVMIQGPAADGVPARPGGLPSPKPRRAGRAKDTPPLHVIPHACVGHDQTAADPEELDATQTESSDPLARSARSLGITGAGVKVAFLADGLDTQNINFIRADGRSVFSRPFGGDYQNFSGDGPGQVTSGAEAFADANAIAGQGIHVYDISGFSAQPDPSACDIRIEGTAPGAALVGLDVFGTFEFTLVSNYLEAISYAVETDHVNVLNESFGGNPFPDTTALNVLKRFNDAAVAAGVTVTTSSGDSGTTNTIGSPASDPEVISVGASTTFRAYAQTNFAAARYFASTGWINDNVSALSSAGFTAAGGTVSLVAPGDFSFASCSTNANLYVGCQNMNGAQSPVELSGGTSEAAPLTAGAAALVIEAYRRTHHGGSPSPALVKQILTSTATDLGLPATEQGTGLLNSYKAVLLAESIKTAAGTPTPVGDTLLLSRSKLTASGWPGTRKSWRIRVTNTGAHGQLVVASGRGLGPDTDIQAGSVKLSDATSPQLVDANGIPDNYATFHFTVLHGAARLGASIAYPGTSGAESFSPVWLILVDPRGQLAADSFPQGTSDFGGVDVRAPVPGVWTGVVMGIVGADNGTNGTVHWQVATQRFTRFGAVAPHTFYLLPGQSRILHVTETLPEQAGDVTGSIVLRSNLGGTDPNIGTERDSIPVTARSMVDIASGGSFGGVLTGGNGRSPGIGEVSYFEFMVGRGRQSIAANVTLTNDAADNVGAYLVAPDGQALGFGQNTFNGTNERSLTAYTFDPTPGIWTLVIDFAGAVAGDEVSQHFYGTIRRESTRASASGLPDNPRRHLTQNRTLTVPVRVTNIGKAPEAYFVDARLAKLTTLVLDSEDGQTFILPLSADLPEWLMPTEATSVRVTAQATVPIEFDWGSAQGDPDLFAPPGAKDSAMGAFAPAGGSLQPGNWVAAPDELGPYAHKAKLDYVTMAMTVTAKAFDPAVTASTADLWALSLDVAAPFNPVIIDPGKSATIKVSIRPTGRPGTVVRGYLYVDDFIAGVPPYSQQTGDELVAIPYAYTIAAPP